MKTKISPSFLITTALALSLGVFSSFADESGKDHRSEPGPNGGRLVVGEDFKLEFFVTDERKVQISFLNDQGEVVAPKDQAVSLVGGDRSDPTRLQFETKGKVLLSKSALPDLKNMPAILNVKASPGAEPVRERFNINMSTCPECSLHEYACICGHEEEREHGHSHGPDADHQHK
ncbi:MAG: hypothetical protein O3C43_17690 [Verrucomicrobia bacterium]|nr:hypothetical protein [Verrucomicrobiota bacterium]